jgi:hypothetical protein
MEILVVNSPVLLPDTCGNSARFDQIARLNSEIPRVLISSRA